ncbi:MAG: polysaccharide pyruvyl transferase family protein [Kiritimatiellia bacterium]
MNILIINQWATNKGDRAVLFFELRELARQQVHQVRVSTSDPNRWRQLPGIPNINVDFVPCGWGTIVGGSLGPAGKVLRRLKLMLRRGVCYPLIRRSLIAGRCPWYLSLICNRQFLAAVREADLVISTGGHRITTINAPEGVGPQWFDIAVTILCGKPLVIWSQSIGPFAFRSERNRAMVTAMLSAANRIFIRDDASRHEVEALGVSTMHLSQTHESVLGLFDVVTTRRKPTCRPATLGISVYATNRRTKKAFSEYVRCLGSLVNHAIEVGYQKVLFFPMELERADRPCIESVISRTLRKDRCEIVEGFPETVEHLNAIAECRMFLGHKTHSVIFALVAGTPVLALAYHKKTEDFMSQFGLREYCVPDSEMNEERLLTVFENINANLDAISEQESRVGAELGKKVREDFATLFAAQ